MSKTTNNSKLRTLPPINKKTDIIGDSFELKHGYKLPSTFDTDSKYNKILETQTGTETPRGTLPSLLNADSKARKLENMIKAHDSLPPININSKNYWEGKPSKLWCEKGIIDREHGERYNPNIHNVGKNAYERCGRVYPEIYGKPSRLWCEKGIIDKEHGEGYNPDIHNAGKNAYERCGHDYPEIYDKPEWGKPELGEPEWGIVKNGGKKRTRRNRKNKKTRKQRRKSVRRNKK